MTNLIPALNLESESCMTTFTEFLEQYKNTWMNSSLVELKDIISKDYKAREVRQDDIIDFGYEESIAGWEQGFKFVKDNEAEWILNQIAVIPLRKSEFMVVITATIAVEHINIETANLFFQTFKRDSNGKWKLVRSYIEAGLPKDEFLNNTLGFSD